MWQGLARLFGHDLKSQYDPTGDDAAIEHILHAHGLAFLKRTGQAVAWRLGLTHSPPRTAASSTAIFAPHGEGVHPV